MSRFLRLSRFQLSRHIQIEFTKLDRQPNLRDTPYLGKKKKEKKGLWDYL